MEDVKKTICPYLPNSEDICLEKQLIIIMRRKKLAQNSLQQIVVDFLKENSFKSFEAQEIKEATNEKSGKSRSIGSISGTLKVLCEGGWVVKSDDYPSRYSYKEEFSDKQETSSDTEEMTIKPIETNQQQILDELVYERDNIKKEIADYNSKIENLKIKLELLDKILSKRVSSE
ncbi:MAG: hypothetical protein SWJ54_15755 [Cyanobacteriota bacterium]|nr:hypothetical protein [Cyanobacteriota bacterium]